MKIDAEFRDRLVKIFQPLNTRGASRAFPKPRTLESTLEPIIRSVPRKKRINVPIPTRPATASCFATAAVEIWFRAIDSFLASIALTENPIWASVTGYYSSHYSVRGVAHLLGYFWHFKEHQLVKLDLKPSGGFYIRLPNKPRGMTGRSEHQLYWALVKADPGFADDSLFGGNQSDIDESDSAHRVYANYIDHLNQYHPFNLLEKELIKVQVDKISKTTLESIPIPNRSKFPDPNVQIIAYRRLVGFRNILNTALADTNNFWKVSRNPSFAPDYLKFQLAENIELIDQDD